jgi:hypothetical protein
VRHNKYKTKLCQKFWILGYSAYGPRQVSIVKVFRIVSGGGEGGSNLNFDFLASRVIFGSNPCDRFPFYGSGFFESLVAYAFQKKNNSVLKPCS